MGCDATQHGGTKRIHARQKKRGPHGQLSTKRRNYALNPDDVEMFKGKVEKEGKLGPEGRWAKEDKEQVANREENRESRERLARGRKKNDR